MANLQSSPEASSLQHHIDHVTVKARQLFGRDDEPVIVVSPYRMNPIGAHVDHQGGSVLARTINQYTLLALYPTHSQQVILHCDNGERADTTETFNLSGKVEGENWVRYAKASAACFESLHSGAEGFAGLVFGTLVGAGLSSSASVILSYLAGLAHVNNLQLSNKELVELCRRVENEYMGLNNGLQDQMSIVFGRQSGLSLLDMDSVSAEYCTNPQSMDDVSWVVCYSGFSRELVSSGFNDRVKECREAANQLDANASILGEVSMERRSSDNLNQLAPHLARRAQHVFSEMQRVEQGREAWQCGDWKQFGALMNQSCYSSINHYECGSQPMVDLHQIALQQPAVYGSRFGGGGYGGCLMMLVRSEDTDRVKNEVLKSYLEHYPEKTAQARAFVADAESCVRVVSS